MKGLVVVAIMMVLLGLAAWVLRFGKSRAPATEEDAFVDALADAGIEAEVRVESRPDADSEKWIANWANLESAFRSRLGETEPAGKVFPVHGALSLTNPGLCVLAFKPTQQRQTWLYSTMGVPPPTRPLESGIGAEFTIETSVSSEWPAQILSSVINGLNSGNSISAGDAITCTIAKRKDGVWVLSGPDPEKNDRSGLKRQGTVAAMLVFPNLAAKGPLETTTEPVALLSLTFVPEPDERSHPRGLAVVG